jgi:hypothetical protein
MPLAVAPNAVRLAEMANQPARASAVANSMMPSALPAGKQQRFHLSHAKIAPSIVATASRSSARAVPLAAIMPEAVAVAVAAATDVTEIITGTAGNKERVETALAVSTFLLPVFSKNYTGSG